MDVAHSETDLVRSAEPTHIVAEVIDGRIRNRGSRWGIQHRECAGDAEQSDLRIVVGMHVAPDPRSVKVNWSANVFSLQCAEPCRGTN